MMNGSRIGQIIPNEKCSFFSADESKNAGNHIRYETNQPSGGKKKEQEQKGADSGFYGKIGRQFAIENQLIGQVVNHSFLSNKNPLWILLLFLTCNIYCPILSYTWDFVILSVFRQKEWRNKFL